jgi:hypothetical protein
VGRGVMEEMGYDACFLLRLEWARSVCVWVREGGGCSQGRSAALFRPMCFCSLPLGGPAEALDAAATRRRPLSSKALCIRGLIRDEAGDQG